MRNAVMGLFQMGHGRLDVKWQWTAKSTKFERINVATAPDGHAVGPVFVLEGQSLQKL